MDTLKNIIGRILDENPAYKEKESRSRVFDAWPRLVGERVARHCWPITMFEDGTLLVGAESSAWLHSLHYLEAQILEKYEKELGTKQIKAIRFKLEARPAPSS